MEITAWVNVVDGTITVIVPGDEDTDFSRTGDGKLRGTRMQVEPWGVEEYELDRADAALVDLGWRRAGEWLSGEPATHSHSCPVEPA